jgi:TctA family transporter
VLSAGDHKIFLQDPVSLGLLIAAAVLIFYSLIKRND